MKRSSKAAAHWLWAEYLPPKTPEVRRLKRRLRSALRLCERSPFWTLQEFSPSTQLPLPVVQRRLSARPRSLGAIHLSGLIPPVTSWLGIWCSLPFAISIVELGSASFDTSKLEVVKGHRRPRLPNNGFK